MAGTRNKRNFLRLIVKVNTNSNTVYDSFVCLIGGDARIKTLPIAIEKNFKALFQKNIEVSKMLLKGALIVKEDWILIQDMFNNDDYIEIEAIEYSKSISVGENETINAREEPKECKKKPETQHEFKKPALSNEINKMTFNETSKEDADTKISSSNNSREKHVSERKKTQSKSSKRTFEDAEAISNELQSNSNVDVTTKLIVQQSGKKGEKIKNNEEGGAHKSKIKYSKARLEKENMALYALVKNKDIDITLPIMCVSQEILKELIKYLEHFFTLAKSKKKTKSNSEKLINRLAGFICSDDLVGITEITSFLLDKIIDPKKNKEESNFLEVFEFKQKTHYLVYRKDLLQLQNTISKLSSSVYVSDKNDKKYFDDIFKYMPLSIKTKLCPRENVFLDSAKRFAKFLDNTIEKIKEKNNYLKYCVIRVKKMLKDDNRKTIKRDNVTEKSKKKQKKGKKETPNAVVNSDERKKEESKNQKRKTSEISQLNSNSSEKVQTEENRSDIKENSKNVVPDFEHINKNKKRKTTGKHGNVISGVEDKEIENGKDIESENSSKIEEKEIIPAKNERANSEELYNNSKKEKLKEVELKDSDDDDDSSEDGHIPTVKLTSFSNFSESRANKSKSKNPKIIMNLASTPTSKVAKSKKGNETIRELEDFEEEIKKFSSEKKDNKGFSSSESDSSSDEEDEQLVKNIPNEGEKGIQTKIDNLTDENPSNGIGKKRKIVENQKTPQKIQNNSKRQKKKAKLDGKETKSVKTDVTNVGAKILKMYGKIKGGNDDFEENSDDDVLDDLAVDSDKIVKKKSENNEYLATKLHSNDSSDSSEDEDSSESE